LFNALQNEAESTVDLAKFDVIYGFLSLFTDQNQISRLFTYNLRFITWLHCFLHLDWNFSTKWWKNSLL